MNNPTDTNQANEDELRDMLSRLQEGYADSLSDVFLTDTQVDVLAEDLLPFIRTEKLKLLAEVRERVIGEDKKPTGSVVGLVTIDTARNKLRAEMRNELTKLEAEL